MKNSAINFFLDNKDSLAEYIEKIKVNREKTLVKYGWIEDQNIKLAFFTYGELSNDITSYEEKIECLFNSNNDLTELDEVIREIRLPYKFSFAPYLKISKDNEILTYAFQISINFEKA